MARTYQELSNAVFQLATEEQLSNGIPQHVLDRLPELGMVHLEVDTSPQLTECGRKALMTIEDGDTVPDFDWSN